jgi:hypothetical protein
VCRHSSDASEACRAADGTEICGRNGFPLVHPPTLISLFFYCVKVYLSIEKLPVCSCESDTRIRSESFNRIRFRKKRIRIQILYCFSIKIIVEKCRSNVKYKRIICIAKLLLCRTESRKLVRTKAIRATHLNLRVTMLVLGSVGSAALIAGNIKQIFVTLVPLKRIEMIKLASSHLECCWQTRSFWFL